MAETETGSRSTDERRNRRVLDVQQVPVNCAHVCTKSDRIEAISERVDELHDSLSIFTSNVSTLTIALTRATTLLEGIPERVRSLENWRWYIMGGLAILSLLFAGEFIKH